MQTRSLPRVYPKVAVLTSRECFNRPRFRGFASGAPIQSWIECRRAFNPFSLFDGALVLSEILRSPDLLPSEKLVFAADAVRWREGKGLAFDRTLSRGSRPVGCASAALCRFSRIAGVHIACRSIRAIERIRVLMAAGFEIEPHSRLIGPPRSCVRALPQSQVSGPGHSSVIARRESIESSSIEEIQIEKIRHLRAQYRKRTG